MNTPRPLRLDTPNGPAVALIGPPGDGYVKVRSLQSGLAFEALASRLRGGEPNT